MVGCSQPTIARERPIVWSIWRDNEDLYFRFQRQLEDDMQRKVLKGTLEGKTIEEMVRLLSLSTEKVREALEHIFEVRYAFRCRLRRDYAPQRLRKSFRKRKIDHPRNEP
jgi:hypothetical protein